MVLTGATCACPIGFYPDTGTTSCLRCHWSCATCTANTSTTCSTCYPGVTFSASTGSCPCPWGTYPDNPTSACALCHSTCGTCVGPNPTDCTTCAWTSLSLGGGGVSDSCTCPNGYWVNSIITPPQCSACHYTCRTCSGALATNCLTCAVPFILSGATSCKCANRTYYNSTTNKC